MTFTEVQIPGYLAGTWQIDPTHSHVGFMIKHMMVSKVRGHFTSFRGQIVTAPEPLRSSVTATIDASSIDTGNEGRDDHVRSADFFAADQHPTLNFRSTAVRYENGDFIIDGVLTICGVTRPVTLALETPLFQATSDGGGKVGFSATTEISRSDYGVSYNGPLPGGGTALGEKVQIVLEIEADLVRES